MATSTSPSTLRTRCGRVLLALVTIVSLGLVASPASASTAVRGVQAVRLNAYEARLVQLVNQARADNGLPRLIVTAGATDVARDWAADQANADRMSHNPAFARQLESAGGTHWTWAAENVGFGNAGDPDQLFQLYMHSPLHRANILSPRARYLGMGVVPRLVYTWLMVYNTMNFNDYYDPSYGVTRTPAAALPLDGAAIPATTYVASFEHGPDLRVGAAAHGELASSTPLTDVPTPHDDAVRWTVRDPSGGSDGYVDLELHQAMDLSNATTMQLRLQADAYGLTDVPVTVLLARYGSAAVAVGIADVTRTKTMFSFDLPPTARDYRDTIVVRVPASAVRGLPLVNRDRSVRMSLFAVRVF